MTDPHLVEGQEQGAGMVSGAAAKASEPALVSDQAASHLDPSGFDQAQDVPVSIQNITPTCRANRGEAQALAAAFARISHAYLDCVGAEGNDGVTWRLSLVRVEPVK